MFWIDSSHLINKHISQNCIYSVFCFENALSEEAFTGDELRTN